VWGERIGPAEREVLRFWLLTRVALFWLAGQAGWFFGLDRDHVVSYLDGWYTWDAQYYVKIAAFGYNGPPGNTDPLEAFFPGLPLVLKVVHVVVWDWRLAGLVVSFFAGCVAVVALVRLAQLDNGPVAATRTGLFFSIFPMTVFLSAGYTEALFLACAIPAWLQARRGRWWAAALLAAAASTVRVTGLFLAVALIVEFATGWLPGRLRPRRSELTRPPVRAAGWLIVPFLPGLAYGAYLRVRTGNWFYWLTAENIGWGRHTVGFVNAFRTTWAAAFGDRYTPNFQWAFRLELAMAALGLVLVVVLLIRSQYGEATYVGFSLVALTTSTLYLSIGRAALVWWPLFTMLGAIATRPRWGAWAARLTATASVPLAVLLATAFTTWHWAG
jgi:mannosyltransferase PIG-V